MGAPDKSRILAGFASATLDALILVSLIAGLRDHSEKGSSSRLMSVAFTAPPAPRQRKLKPLLTVYHPHRRAAGRASARAAPALAYAPRISLTQPALPAAPQPDNGLNSNAGTVGAASGGGAGNGNSGGGAGGDLGGYSGTDAEWISGQIGNSDYPHLAADRGAQGTVGTEITVSPNGRASSCQVTRSSGDPDLDAETCRLILRRFRFRSATDDAGRSIVDTVEYDQEWVLNQAADLPASAR